MPGIPIYCTDTLVDPAKSRSVVFKLVKFSVPPYAVPTANIVAFCLLAAGFVARIDHTALAKVLGFSLHERF